MQRWRVVSGWRRVRLCSTDASFKDEYILPDYVTKRLCEQGLARPNDLQRKCLAGLFAGDYSAAVINAETGSGKTHCFILPVINLFSDLWKRHGSIPCPSAVVLVPTPHLGHQIDGVYRGLALPEWGSCVTYTTSRLLLKPTTSLVIATPSTLVQYDLERVLRCVRIVCVDEADLLLTGSEREPTWKILDTMKRLFTADKRNRLKARDGQTSEDGTRHTSSSCHDICKRQFIFTAATLPSGGRQTVQSRLNKWLPKGSIHISSDLTHQILPTAEMDFINIATACGALATPEPTTRKVTEVKREQLLRDLYRLKADSGAFPKIVVFCNSVTSAESVFTFINGSPTDEMNCPPAKGTTPTNKTRSSKHQLNELCDPHDLCTLTPPRPWWMGKAGRLFKGDGASVECLEKTLNRFKSGELCVLVASDLGCRGLDIQDVTAVILFDFPGNVADFLHRAGRTARAGKSGTVICYVEPSSRDLADEIRAVLADRTKNFESLFSRNKMLRRKIKRKQKQKISDPTQCSTLDTSTLDTSQQPL